MTVAVLSEAVEWVVRCDAPGCNETYEGLSGSCLLVMDHAVADGWTRTGGDGMLCPAHSGRTV